MNGGSGGDGYLGARPGNGAAGATGGAVSLGFNFGDPVVVRTTGQGSVGVWVMSVGGNGGSGGNGVISKNGGNGGQGGDGGKVEINTTFQVTTYGADAVGLLAQSVGGKGGAGGDTYVTSSGGDGAGGADGGSAIIDSGGSITTQGDRAYGVVAQSIGGFGGNAGDGHGVFTYGGDARTAGNGGYAAATNDTGGSITTYGADAYGLVAESTGGGGGLGGDSSGIKNVGGRGASGGKGGTVKLANLGSIMTMGAHATGMLAQSIGGGGGSGGSSYGYISFGGDGGTGGNGGNVAVEAVGGVTTKGDSAVGMLAESIGGGGGTGGAALSAGPLISVAVGGKGGDGGDGGTVSVTQPRTSVGVNTSGLGSTGIFLQSVGGGGGSANWTASMAAGPVAGSVAVGGSGGKGGRGGAVNANLNGYISTDGDRSVGLLAQSMGGGGGNAGLALSIAAATNGSFSVGVGGDAGNGSDGKAVSVLWRGEGIGIKTHGKESGGILAQSAGRGGGNASVTFVGGAAGTGNLSLALGGKGGSGGNAGNVTISSTGAITTNGDGSAGVLGESVAGGGGNGGLALAGGFAGGGNLTLGLGGSGGGGADAGEVSVAVTGTVKVSGANSAGVVASSVGGGGGTGGIAGTFSGSPTIALALSLGANGGNGGSGNSVSADYSGTLTTDGAWSNGITARSVGGGGGDGSVSAGASGSGVLSGTVNIGGGAGAGGNGGLVKVSAAGSITTKQDNSDGIEASSISGGGGDGGVAAGAGLALGGTLAANVGGKGGNGGSTGPVFVSNSANIATQGTKSIGILAQSIAGGGGSGGITGTLAASKGGSLALAMGGKGAQGGNSGTVKVSNTGGIVTTAGDNAQALLAQSIAGGGGTGGIAVSAAGAVGFGGASLALGGDGSGGGTAGDVTVTSTNFSIYATRGAASEGILAQSVGGGGGSGGLTISGAGAVGVGAATVAVGGSGGNGGKGGNVKVELVDGQVSTAGVNSAGVKAESIGGGGGDGGATVAATLGTATTQAAVAVGGSGGDGATAGNVTLSAVDETISTTGDMSAGMSAQSVARGGGNGGLAVTGSILLAPSNSLGVAVGGSGGSGSNSGDVSLAFGVGATPGYSNKITTTGAKSYGLLAQSIGGGGGVGGMAVSGQISMAAANANVAVGGTGGSGNNAGKVTLQVGEAAILTGGTDAIGVLAESIGGGGGEGGIAASGSLSFTPGGGAGMGINVAVGGKGGMIGGDANTVTLDVAATGRTGSIVTDGKGATGIVARSIGGGGGYGGAAFTALATNNAVKSVDLAIGGVGGTGGNGGAVNLSNRDTVRTKHAGGIFAESVGGGGGDGGVALSVAIAAGAKSLQSNSAVGGDGGQGGNGAAVTLTNSGDVTTLGDASYGVFATSVGGGGGAGGSALSGTIGGGSTLNVGVTVGGSGRTGGQGGAVTVTNSGKIATWGLGSKGLVATSVGGGGGWGRAALALDLGGKSSINASVAVGGKGGSGGIARAVKVNELGGSIVTQGDNATAIEALSVGGGGGIGGFAFTQTLSGGSFSGDLSVSVGGNGGKGGTGNTVDVLNGAALSTFGENAYGIFAQSTGGGGGDAGLASASSGTVASQNGGAIAFAIGGRGGASGDGDTVTVGNSGAISTSGGGAIGIYAESVGGGGGNGGAARGTAEALAVGSGGTTERAFGLSASIGGDGGASGNGGTVQVTNTGDILVEGQDAQGIYADSTGGGGGTGGSLNASGGILVKAAKFINSLTGSGDAFPFSVNIGGDGGASGNGGAVSINNSGRIQTRGTGGSAIEVHSAGGGGGSGGNGLIGRINVGGKGGAAGNGGNIDVTNTGSLSTVGAKDTEKDSQADGIFAQSIGGGGGSGGNTDTIGSTTVSDLSELGVTISSYADYGRSIADVIRARKKLIGISIGGSGGASGSGGSVNVTNGGSITTDGSYANGIFAQSVGGGGGTGGVGVLLAPTQITLPGQGANAGNGGDVTVNNSGAILTKSNASMGIFAQSVGGGGGVAGAYAFGMFGILDLPGMNFVDGGLVNYTKIPGTLPASGDSGNGGNIRITSTADIAVQGLGSIGILAQTAGGGGGLIGGAGAEFLGTFGNKGNGGNIDLTQSGAITASGANGIGILLQSVGYVPAAPQGRAAASEHNGMITASIGGTITGGSGVMGAAMMVSGGSTNKITILSTGSLSAASGVAFLSGSGDDTLINQGKITGTVEMGDGQNVFDNQGQFYAGRITRIGVNVVGKGATGQFTNGQGGMFQAGDGTAISAVTLDGSSFVQTDGGTLSVLLHDASYRGTAGLASSELDVSGAVRLKGGSIRFSLDASGTLPVDGSYFVPILTGRDGLQVAGDVTVASSNPLVSATLSQHGDGLGATVRVDYTPPQVPLSPTQSAVGDAIAAIARHEKASIHPLLGATRFQQGVSNSNFTPFAIADALDPVELAGSAEQLMDVYQSLSPAAYAAAQAAQLYAAVGFNDTLLADGSAASHRVANDNGGVAWLDFTGRRYSADFAPTRFSESGFGPSAGVSMELAGGWKVGAGVGYQSIADHMSDFSSGSGFRIMAGLTAEHDLGPLDGEIALSAGAQDLRTDRRVHAFDGALYTTAKQTSAFGTATFRLSHEFDFGDWQVRPMIDASIAVLGMPGVTETGAAPLNLDVYGDTTTSFRIGPAVDIKGKTTVFGLPVEPQLKVGFSDWVAGGNPQVRADFMGLAGMPDMVSAQPGSDITADVTAGVGMDTGEGIDLRVFYTGHLNGETQIHAINFQASYHF